MTPDPNCVFCKSLADPERAWSANLIWHFPHSVAILGPWQFYTGYSILISRAHATELSQLGPNRAAFLDEMATLAQAVEECYRPHKLNYELLGNQVPHLHWHIFPRAADDPDRLRPVWFALEKADTDAAEKARLGGPHVSRGATVARLRDWLKANKAPTL
jgi:diadenosine tetraphosphate (Ap4A) HIT family hydrolase